MYAIETHELTKTFRGTRAVNALNMHVPEGAIYGFLGENGSGKSTTEKMITGLMNPKSGSNTIILVVGAALLIGGGAFYYFKIYKGGKSKAPKKVVPDDDEEDETEFDDPNDAVQQETNDSDE